MGDQMNDWRTQGMGRKARKFPTKLDYAMVAILFVASIAFLIAFAASAKAAPTHPRNESLDVTTGLNHACGVAVDSKGDLYLSSAGESKIKVYNSSHTLLTEISDANTPCGLAVTSEGDLYVSEKATGKVVRFKPSKYPFEGTPTYGSAEAIDSSGKAKGIAVDRTALERSDSRLYVAAGDHVAAYKSDGTFEANLGEGDLTEASGVASFTYVVDVTKTGEGKFLEEKGTRFLFVADANGIGPDTVKVFTGSYLFASGTVTFGAPKLRRELNGATTPDGSFGFGAAGAYLAADPGNRNVEKKCAAVAAQACTSGHLLVYDAAHKALDEFDASGEYLDRTANAAFSDAEPTAIAIDRSGGSGDGTLYVTAGAGAGAKALAFGPLKPPARETLGEPISRILEEAHAVATDSHGDVYVAAEGLIHVYGPKGEELTEFEDEGKPIDLAVDSTGKVYVLDEKESFKEAEVAYYEPESGYPPEAGSGYTRGSPIVIDEKDFPGSQILKAIAVKSGPGSGKDRLFITSGSSTQLYKSAAEGSGLIDKEFAKCITGNRQSIAVNGATGYVYFGMFTVGTNVVNEAGECLWRFDSKGNPNGKTGTNPYIAVDKSNGHVIEFDGKTSTAHEYDAAGGFVAEFGNFTENLTLQYRVAVSPVNGNVYLAFDDTNSKHPPYDLTAFGPLKYPEVPTQKLTVKKTGTGSGKVTSSPAGIDCGSKCSAEFPETDVVTLTAIPNPNSKFE